MVKLLALAPGGRREDGGKDGAVCNSWRHGGPEHGYWIHEIARALRREGWTVTVERRIGGGKTVDLEAKKDGRRVAVEVETGKSDAMANILKDLEEDYDTVVSVATDKRTAERIRRQLSAAGLRNLEKVAVMHTGQIMDLIAGLDKLGTAGTARAIAL